MRAILPSVSGYSTADLATTTIFTDPTLVAATTLTKAIHVTELRTAVVAVRVLANIAAFPYTDPGLSAGFAVRAVRINDLRNALNGARATLLLPPITCTRAVAAGITVATADINDLRTGVR